MCSSYGLILDAHITASRIAIQADIKNGEGLVWELHSRGVVRCCAIKEVAASWWQYFTNKCVISTGLIANRVCNYGGVKPLLNNATRGRPVAGHAKPTKEEVVLPIAALHW
jgi:hypothetical protein